MNRRHFLQESLGLTLGAGAGLFPAGTSLGSEPAAGSLSPGRKDLFLEETYCCNVAGYIGGQAAAPILLDMMERQEGFAGGFYSGIATIAGGTLHYAKVIGDIAALRAQTGALRLPGHVGIIHSRSKSGGDREWAHPFIDCKNQMAYLANGHDGFFEDKRDKHAIANRLAAEGHVFRSHSTTPIGKYPVLSSGVCVHTSEVMCHLIESLVDACGSPAEAMRRAFMTFPAEIVGLMVHCAAPGSIIASRINQPLMIGRDAGATYLATTALAFPDGVDQWCSPMAANATGVFTHDRMEILPFDPPPAPVAGLFPWQRGYDKILETLSDGSEHDLSALMKATAPLWPSGVVSQKDMMVYEILRSLCREGRMRLVDTRVQGVLAGSTVSRKRMSLVP